MASSLARLAVISLLLAGCSGVQGEATSGDTPQLNAAELEACTFVHSLADDVYDAITNAPQQWPLSSTPEPEGGDPLAQLEEAVLRAQNRRLLDAYRALNTATTTNGFAVRGRIDDMKAVCQDLGFVS